MTKRSAAADAVAKALRAAASRVPEVLGPGQRVVVAFSGGQDSSCLLHALLSSRVRREVIAAHIDHGLRPDSAASAQRAVALAERIGARCEVRRVEVAIYRRLRPRWSLQHAARAARYRALASVVHELGAAALLVAHTADDQAETLILNLLRGAGLDGLVGMPLDETLELARLGPPLAELPAPAELRVARPLLCISRASTLAYCADFGLELVDDPSNQSRAYTRNRVRLDLLPALEAFNPAIRRVLARTADLVAGDAAALDLLTRERFEQLAQRRDPFTIEFDLPGWRRQPWGLQRRLLRAGLAALLGGLENVPASPIDDALELVRSGATGQAYHLPEGVELCLARATFVLRRFGRARAKRPIP